MNESAILHIPDSQYCFAVGEKKLVIRLRMAKEDADASVTLIYAASISFSKAESRFRWRYVIRTGFIITMRRPLCSRT